LAFITSSYQQSGHETVATQNEELTIDYSKAFNSMDFDILEGLLTESGAEMLPESAVLEACCEQPGVFLVPAGLCNGYESTIRST
jgi:hypothetical protein